MHAGGAWLLACLVAVAAPVLGAAGTFQEPAVSSFVATAAAREAFLATARIVTDAPADARRSWRVSLDDGVRKHDALVETADGSDPTRRNYRFNLAAYELDKLLGVNLVVPSVARTVWGRPASLTWWMDDFAMNELDRRRQRIDPPDSESWNRQMQAVRVFDELISNTYRDTAPALYLNSVWDNLLITKSWTIWLTDHTGSFRTRQRLEDEESLARIDRAVWARLTKLNREQLQKALSKYLSSDQLDALEARRVLLVRHFEKQIASSSEGAVIFDLPKR
jgi:hypothetical protein